MLNAYLAISYDQIHVEIGPILPYTGGGGRWAVGGYQNLLYTIDRVDHPHPSSFVFVTREFEFPSPYGGAFSHFSSLCY